ncbi:MAG: hypothetical protein LBR53_03030 [Deltaproteobacteria bacterium]|nr:hypothetical protein [Deltaproteobacteria bacterium]
MDILAKYKGRFHPVELKIKSSDKFTDLSAKSGLEQSRSRMDKDGAKEGWLVIFGSERRKKFRGEDRLENHLISKGRPSTLLDVDLRDLRRSFKNIRPPKLRPNV